MLWNLPWWDGGLQISTCCFSSESNECIHDSSSMKFHSKNTHFKNGWWIATQVFSKDAYNLLGRVSVTRVIAVNEILCVCLITSAHFNMCCISGNYWHTTMEGIWYVFPSSFKWHLLNIRQFHDGVWDSKPSFSRLTLESCSLPWFIVQHHQSTCNCCATYVLCTLNLMLHVRGDLVM